MTDRQTWILIRRALLNIVRTLDKRYGVASTGVPVDVPDESEQEAA